VPIRVATAATKPTPVELNTIGSVQTIASVAVKSRLDAVIDQVLVKDGQFVKAGDVLFRLDSRAAAATVHQAEAALARDQVQLANANRNFERDKSLMSKDFVSHQQYDNDAAAAAALDATVKSDQAQLENAKVLLSYYVITAPIDGRVGLIAIKQGNSIKSNDVPLATVNQIQPIYVSFALPQTDLAELRAAMALGPVSVQVLAQGDKGTPVTGKIAFFENTIDATSGTITVRATFDNN
jgi:RND family efflux transporter MFP subunit